jgi:polyphenol oxidase
VQEIQNEGVIVVDDLDVVRVPGWERFGWLRYGFSTRAGGISAVYGGRSLNLGWTKEDDAASVAENRRRFVGEIGGGASLTLVGVRQIHSDIVRVVREGDGAFEGRLQTAEGKAVLEGDGLMTDVPGVLVGVGTADCVPVLVVDGQKKVVAAFHAGWRGTVAGIVEQGVARMVSEYGSRVKDLVAAVGPSIGACCYSVGHEVRREFRTRFGYGEELFRVGSEEDPGGQYLDLWEANRRQLLGAGLGEEQIYMVGECTACSQDEGGAMRYFSHRGEKGVAGRMLSVVGVAR